MLDTCLFQRPNTSVDLSLIFQGMEGEEEKEYIPKPTLDPPRSLADVTNPLSMEDLVEFESSLKGDIKVFYDGTSLEECLQKITQKEEDRALLQKGKDISTN